MRLNGGGRCAGHAIACAADLFQVRRPEQPHPCLRLWALLQDNAIERVFAQSEEGLASGEVAREGSGRGIADKRSGVFELGTICQAPGTERTAVVIRVVEKSHQFEVGLPTEHEL